MKIRTSEEIKAAISFSSKFKHLDEDHKEKWVSVDSLLDELNKIQNKANLEQFKGSRNYTEGTVKRND